MTSCQVSAREGLTWAYLARERVHIGVGPQDTRSGTSSSSISCAGAGATSHPSPFPHGSLI